MAGIRACRLSRIISTVLIALMCVAVFPAAGAGSSYAASVNAKGKISSSDVNMRKSWSTSSKRVRTLKNKASVKVSCEIFTSRTGTSASKRWYAVSKGGKSGYVRADLVRITSWACIEGYTTDTVNYRKGPATSFKKLGTAGKGAEVTVLLAAKRPGGSTWYKVRVNGRTAYMHSDYVHLGTYESSIETGLITGFREEFSRIAKLVKSDPAKKLQKKATSGGKERVVYTFDSKNCTKLFPLTGSGNTQVPQAFTFTGKKYYVLYGMENSQCIITYNAKGKRLKVTKFPKNYGHLNGITWDPQTKLCYIFKGCQYTIYTWDPETDKFGSVKLKYSSSGAGYDPVTKKLYASSESVIRVYSAEGKFSLIKRFVRCDHDSGYHVQDCAAYNGFVFHCTSGSDRYKDNCLDVYRSSDGKYLGSIKVKIDEIESAVVGSDGYVQLLINTAQRTDYVWKTPLNVNDLK